MTLGASHVVKTNGKWCVLNHNIQLIDGQLSNLAVPHALCVLLHPPRRLFTGSRTNALHITCKDAAHVIRTDGTDWP
jgi:hypothetical protein